MVRFAVCACILFFACFAVPAAAQEPADNAIGAAVADLDRFEKQAADYTESSKSGITRTLKLLSLTEERLNSSSNQSDASWIAANQRLQDLKGRLTALRDGQAAPPPTAEAPASGSSTAQPEPAASATPTPTATETVEVDPDVERAQRELHMINRQVDSMREGDPRMTERFLRDLDRIGQSLTASPDQGKPNWAEADAAHKATLGRLVEGRTALLGNELADLGRKFDGMIPVQFQVAETVASIRGKLDQIGSEKDKLNAPDHPAVAELSARLVRANEMLDAKVAEAEAELASLGDVFGKMNTIAQVASTYPVPGELASGVVTQARVKEYLTQAIASEKVATEALPFLRELGGKVAMTVDQSNFYNRLMGELEGRPQLIRRSLDITTSHIDGGLDMLDHTIQFVDETDPTDVNHHHRFLGDNDSYERTIKELEDGLDQVAAAAQFDKAISRQGGPDRAAQEARIEQALADYRAKYETVLQTIRLPEATSDDEDLLAAAAEILEKEKEFNGFERMVINYGPQRKEKTTTNIELEATSSNTVTGTGTTYHYIWDEFQTTTAEKVGDQYFMFANRFRKYEKGSTTTPIGSWILSGRFKTNMIPKDNIHKD